MNPTTVAQPTARSEFKNVSGHVIGCVTRRPNNEFKSGAVMPGATIWLDEEEQIATANAPREEADNPFTNGDLELVTKAKDIVNRRRIGHSEHPQIGDESPAPAEEPGPDVSREQGGDASGGSSEQGDGDPEPPKTSGKVAPPSKPGAQMTPEQEAQAKAAAQRAVDKAAPTGQEAQASKPAAQGSSTGEVVGTPEAKGK